MSEPKITVENIPVKTRRHVSAIICAVIMSIMFMAGAVALIANQFFGCDWNIFFPGWWTLFIIIPSIFGLFHRASFVGALGGIIFGGTMLAYEQGVFPVEMSFWKAVLFAFIASLLVSIALSIIQGIFFRSKSVESGCRTTVNADGSESVFGNKYIDYSDIEFNGTNLNSVFGEITLDLRKAIINNDCTIKADSVFGKIIILSTPNARFINNNSSSAFGSVSNSSSSEGDVLPTVTIEANSVFGKIEIK